MKNILIKDFEHYLVEIDKICQRKKKINLYRGQATDQPLLPSVCRDDPSLNQVEIEKDMLTELCRRASLFTTTDDNQWNLLVRAQHFGMKTRLLDWTSNPLVALWFACQDAYYFSQDSFVYIFQADEESVVNSTKESSPFTQNKTKILRPTLNNERIIAQSGWFTVHQYSKKNKKFVPLEANLEYKQGVTQFTIPHSSKKEILIKLSRYGVNNRTIFPDLEGLCRHLNWRYLRDIKL
jgi:hypothetical protein